MIDCALDLAACGFEVFPLSPGAKAPPLVGAFPHLATRDPERIRAWWQRWPQANVGVSTSRFGPPDQDGDQVALVVVDVDSKDDRDGPAALLALELAGQDLPDTYTQRTPTGGQHLVYQCSYPLKQGANVLGPGLDIRSRGGYIVGRGSVLEAGAYAGDLREPAWAPGWLVQQLTESTGIVMPAGAGGQAGSRTRAPRGQLAAAPGVDQDGARERAVEYLRTTAPHGGQGSRNETGYRVACRLKDFGLAPESARELMANHWPCSPPLDLPELAALVRSAWLYGQEQVGVDAPELAFHSVAEDSVAAQEPGAPPPAPKKQHPVLELNRHFAYVVCGGAGHILWETTDHLGHADVQHLSIGAFHGLLASKTIIPDGSKNQKLSQYWMQDARRRTYEGMVFEPERRVPERFYNLWRGFGVEPAAEGEVSQQAEDALSMWIEHVYLNVAKGDHDLARWIVGWFAQLVQQPGTKPLTSLVLTGGKGTGKNSLVAPVGHLLGRHFMLTSNRRYLLGNFNSYLERCLFFVLDEAFWSGDKQAVGTLKDLITGTHHVIERKGQEPYEVRNLTRVAILGNDPHLVDASWDERRFAVFEMADTYKQNRAWFQSMREGMEAGGYRRLLRYLLDAPVGDCNAAPATEALQAQKVASLDPLHQWWLECLEAGELVGGEFERGWPTPDTATDDRALWVAVPRDRFRDAYGRYHRDRGIRAIVPDDAVIGRTMFQVCAAMTSLRPRGDDGRRHRAYMVPPLSVCRADWDRWIGNTTAWEGDADGGDADGA